MRLHVALHFRIPHGEALQTVAAQSSLGLISLLKAILSQNCLLLILQQWIVQALVVLPHFIYQITQTLLIRMELIIWNHLM